jgi:lipid-A-disaccharide synthase
MKYYIIAGEASGDLHGSNLMKGLFKEDPQADIRFWGGDLMQNAGGTLVKNYKELAFMGFVEVLLHLKTIVNNISFCKKDITAFQPDVIIYIDYPGFNLRIAKWAKQKGFQNHYYISPQIWAWKENRINDIKRDIDKMYVILPFEKKFYEKKHRFPVEFVGHPLIDAIQNHTAKDAATFRSENQLNAKPIIAILPGSRKQEITKMLSVMQSMTGNFPNYQFVIAGAPNLELSIYKNLITAENINIVSNKTYDLLSNSTAALVTSGTATLETALFKVPQVVCYKSSWISYQIAKRVVNLNYISLVNLIMKQKVVSELIQDKCSPRYIRRELTKVFQPNYRQIMLNQYDDLEKRLGGQGASEKTARLIVESIKPTIAT